MTHKLTIIHEPAYEAPYSVYETIADDALPVRQTSFETEVDARAYCENRQKRKVIAEYSLDG